MLIKNQADLDAFKKMYGIDGEIEKNNNYKCYAKSHHHFILLQISCHIDKI